MKLGRKAQERIAEVIAEEQLKEFFGRAEGQKASLHIPTKDRRVFEATVGFDERGSLELVLDEAGEGYVFKPGLWDPDTGNGVTDIGSLEVVIALQTWIRTLPMLEDEF